MSKVIDLGNGATVEVFPDGTKVQRTADGTTLKMCVDGTKIQTTKTGVQLVVRPDGSRIQTQPNGVSLETFSDGRTLQKNLDGTTIELFPNKFRVQTNPDGTIIEVSPDGSQVQTFPNGQRLRVGKDGKVTVLAEPEKKEKSPRNEKPRRKSTVTGKSDRKKAGTPSAYQSPAFAKLSAAVNNNKPSVATGNSKSPRSKSPRQKSPRHPDKRRGSKSPSNKSTDDLKKRITDLENALLDNEHAHKKEVRHYKSKLRKEVSNLSNMESKYRRAKADFEKKLSQNKSEYKSQVESLKQQVSALEKANEDASQNAKESGQELKAKVTELQSALAAAEKASRGDKQKIVQLKAKIDTQAQKISQVSSDKGQTDSMVEEYEEELASLRVDKESLESQVEDLIYKGGTVAEQVIELKKERGELEGRARIAFSELSDLREELTSNIAQMASNEEQLANSLQEVARMAERAAKAEVLEGRLEFFVEERLRLQERVKALETRIEDESHTDTNELMKKLHDLENIVEESLQKEKDYKIEIENLNKKIIAAQQKASAAEQSAKRVAAMDVVPTLTIPEGRQLRSESVGVSFLSDIQTGTKLKRTPTAPIAGRRPSNANSIAELCKLKAQQRQTRQEQIESLLNKGKS